MKKIAIIGAGGFGREVKMLIDQINAAENKYEFMGYYDDGIQVEEIINGFPVLGKIADLDLVDYDLHIAIAVGNPLYKKTIVKQ